MNVIAIDCEMVGDQFDQAILAKVSLVNSNGTIYDTFVKPSRTVGSMRNTGFTLNQINNGKSFVQVQNEVKQLIKGRILVGHSLDFDLKALGLSHDNCKDIADQYKRNGQRQKLKDLALDKLGERIQTGPYHDSVEDARTALKIYLQNPF